MNYTNVGKENFSNINISSLILHSNADRILPIDAAAIPLSKCIKKNRRVVVQDGPHGIIWTHAEKLILPCSTFSQSNDRNL
jgi:non-heme chloroperoxidase